ncbi:unnamed protein product [Cladocopium goreaui]|uniref:Protein-serine/threonine kinase n=2 Tax=Cladocopium goreaui TaxID=2562237 RepID=A0A9P1G582_9DINO|nr:unnamed protein product [Cladocopium goreaui]
MLLAARRVSAFRRRALFRQTRSAGTSSDRFVYIARERLEELLDAEVGYLSKVPIHPFTLQEVLGLGSAESLAACILNDVPKRFAVRIRMIESLGGWDHIEELNKLHSRMKTWYRRLRLIDPQNVDLQHLTETTRAIRQEGSSTVGLVALGIYKLQRANGQYTDDDLNHFLDGFLLSRIGSNMLLDQYYARAPKEAGGLARKTGIISPRCDAVALCKQAAAYASRICQLHTGQLPVVLYDNYEAGKGACLPDSPCYFSYIPGYLRYIMVEVLKNSFKATLAGATAAEIAERPIHVLICRDECHVAIRVSDRAGGIPSDVGDRIWSYLYGAAARGADEGAATPLAGYGVGLPVSRLHARYLGGQLQLTTYPGFGTDVCVRLPRITSEQVEEIEI